MAADDINIDITNQDYDIDVILDATYFGPGGGGGGGGSGWITYSGTPIAGQIPVFTSVSNVIGTANLVYDGSDFLTPSAIIEEIAVDHISEKTLDHGVIFEHILNSNEYKNVGANDIIGFGGYGYSFVYTGGKATLELDNLTVRNRLAVFELVIQKIKHMGGALMISAGDGEVKSWTGTGPYNLYFDTGNGNEIMFEVDDYVTAQQWSAGVKSFDGQVTYVGADYITVTSSDEPWDGMDLCQFGHPTASDRQNVILLKATDPNNPNNPVIVGYAGIDDGVFAGHMKFTLGNLAGINDPDFGALTGFGLFAENVYLKGKIMIAAGSEGYGNMTDKPDSLGDINSTEGTKLSGIEEGADVTGDNIAAGFSGQGDLATMNTLAWSYLTSVPAYIGAPSGTGLFIDGTHIGYYTAGAWKTYMDSSGNFALGDPTLTNPGLVWNQGTATLQIKGQIIITGSSSGYSNMTDIPDSLSDINSGEGTKLTGIESGATAGATWGTDIDSMPARFAYNTGSPGSAGLFLGSQYMGYWNGSAWKAYIDSSGNCYFEGLSALNCITTAYSEGNMGITISGADLYESEYDGIGILYVNRLGYNGGYTRSRMTYFYNGTGYDSSHLMLQIGYDGVYAYGTYFRVDNSGYFWADSPQYVFEGWMSGYANSSLNIGVPVSICGSGISSPGAGALLELISTTLTFVLNSMTTTQRDNLANPRNGSMIHNTTTNRINIRVGNTWYYLNATAGA